MSNNMGQSKTKIFGIGATGLIGSRITELFADSYPVTNLSPSVGVDITDPQSLSVLREDTEHSTVIHFAAKADVDGCERDKTLGVDGDAWKINVEGVRNVVHALRGTTKKIFYISTDFVFDGKDTPESGYGEDDIPSPINWYAHTKREGEKIVEESGIDYCILRIAYPYRSLFLQKKDFVNAILERLQKRELVKAVTDHVMTPTFVDDIAIAIRTLIEQNAEGIFHVVGSTFISPYDAVKTIANLYELPVDTVEKTTREEFFQGRAPRPFNLSMKNDKIGQLGIKMKTFEEGLFELKHRSQ